MEIELDIDGTGTVQTAVIDRDEEESPHTGRTLRSAETQFMTNGEQAREHVVQALTDGKVTGRSADGARFKVGRHSHSFTQGSAVTTFTVHVKEVEDLSCETVLLGDTVELAPDLYGEEYRDGAVVVTVVTTTEVETTDAFEEFRLRQDRDYFEVVRRGVSGVPLRMRFGRCLYRDNDDGSRTHKVVLVQDVYDDRDQPPFKGFNQPEMRRAEDAIVVLQQTVDRLLDLLVGNGTLSPDTAAAIRDESSAVTRASRRQFDRTEDDTDFALD